MNKLKKLYKENIYGVIGTLVFHILLLSSFLIAKIDMKGEVKEEPILIDFPIIEEEIEEPEDELTQEQPEDEIIPSNDNQSPNIDQGSNQAVNDASTDDSYFDEAYRQEIEAAQRLVSDVNTQLSREIKDIEEFRMPEETTEGMDPSEIENTIYSGESNIHYYLEDRYHLRLPVPVYLAQGGGVITIKIWVSRNGKVVKTEVEENNQIQDPMLPVYAEQAASRTVFNTDDTAPDPQQGTITYTFVPQ